MNLSHREMSAWGSLVLTLLVFGNYYGGLLAGNPPSLKRLALSVLAMIILQIIYQIVISLTFKEEPADERDQWIGLKADRLALHVLATSVFLILLAQVGVVLSTIIPGELFQLSPVGMLNALLLAIILSDVVKYRVHRVGYRRGV